jgi:Putative bacterial sensory transduction regulator
MTLRTVAAAVLFAASPVAAQMTLLGTDVWTEVAPAKVKTILQGMGLEASERAGEKSTVFTFQLASYKVSLDSHTGFMELQLALSDKVTASAMNEWNRTHRFTRAYMDTDGGATIEADLDYGGGVTKATIESFIKGFRDAIPAFSRMVLELEGTGSRPAAASPSATVQPVQPGGSGVLTLLEGRMSLRYDPSRWKQTPGTDPGRYEFTNVRGDGFAVVIAERANIPTDSIADIAFSNIRKQDPNARLTLKQKRRVGGVDVWFQTVDATIKGVPVTYYGYYYGGPAGTVQVLTYTARNLAAEYEKDFLDFLNGFRVSY